jgi:hypothetical protein
MRLLLQLEHAGQAGRHFDATRTTLAYYGGRRLPAATSRSSIRRSRAAPAAEPTFTAGTRGSRPTASPRPGVTVHRPATSLAASSATTSSRTRGWTRVQHLLDRAGRRAGLRSNHLAALLRRLVPWVFRDIALGRETEATASPATGATR